MLPATDNLAAKPARNQPGTLREQFAALDLFLSDPARAIGRDAAWQAARRLTMAHARRRQEVRSPKAPSPIG